MKKLLLLFFFLVIQSVNVFAGRSAADWEVIRSINDQVNASYSYTDRFLGQYRSVDEFIQSGEGGCADFSLAKVHAIQELLPHLKVRWAYGYRTTRSKKGKVAHMVALVEIDGINWVLDNFVSGIYPIQQRQDLLLIFNYIENKSLQRFQAELIDSYGRVSGIRDIVNDQTQQRLAGLFQPSFYPVVQTPSYMVALKY